MKRTESDPSLAAATESDLLSDKSEDIDPIEDLALFRFEVDQGCLRLGRVETYRPRRAEGTARTDTATRQPGHMITLKRPKTHLPKFYTTIADCQINLTGFGQRERLESACEKRNDEAEEIRETQGTQLVPPVRIP